MEGATDSLILVDIVGMVGVEVGVGFDVGLGVGVGVGVDIDVMLGGGVGVGVEIGVVPGGEVGVVLAPIGTVPTGGFVFNGVA